MVNYQNGKIYRIVSDSAGLQYIGSTCQNLSMRMCGHRSDYKRYLVGKYTWVSSFTVLENEDAHVVLVENFPCNTREELLQRERFHIENTQCVNKQITGRTPKEYYEEHRDDITEYYREYYYLNRDKCLEKAKVYRDTNREVIRERARELYHDNREERLRQNQKWREENKDIVRERDKSRYQVRKKQLQEKIPCLCGSLISRGWKWSHERTKKHQEFLASQQF